MLEKIISTLIQPESPDTALSQSGAGMAQAEERHAELAAVADQGRHLLARHRTADVKRRLLRRDVVVHRREHQVGTA